MGGRDDLAQGHPPPQHPSGIWGRSASRGWREPGPPRMRNRSDSASLLFSSFVKPNLFSLIYRQTLKFPGCRPDFGVSQPAGCVPQAGSPLGDPGVGIPGWKGPSIRVRGCGAAERGRRVGITQCLTSPGFSRAGSFPVNCCDSRSGPSLRFPFSHPGRSGLPARDPGAGQSTGTSR